MLANGWVPDTGEALSKKVGIEPVAEQHQQEQPKRGPGRPRKDRQQ